MDIGAEAEAFVKRYYSTFEANRVGLVDLYRDESMLTFEGQRIIGAENIVAKLTSLQQCTCIISTVDCQSFNPTGDWLVFVSGNLQLSGGQHTYKFGQKKTGTGESHGQIQSLSSGDPMDIRAEAKAFVERYYSTFEANQAGLVDLYRDESMLTFEGQRIMGAENIVAMLTSLQQCTYNIITVDCQSFNPTGDWRVFVSGNLQLSGGQHIYKFSQKKTGSGESHRQIQNLSSGDPMDIGAEAKVFVERYYSTFDANRGGLVDLYREESMLTFEGQRIMGAENIVAKLTSLQQCTCNITTFDCQSFNPTGDWLVFISDNLQLSCG